MNRAIALARRALRLAAGLFLVALAFVTIIDVLGRYVFDSPLIGAVELTEALMVGTIFTGIVLATVAHQHITVDLFALPLGPRGRRVQRGLSLLLASGVSLLLGEVTWSQALSALSFGDKTTMLGLPMAPQVFFMSCFLFLNAVIYAVQMWRAFVHPRDPT